jgi:hypothetical protein
MVALCFAVHLPSMFSGYEFDQIWVHLMILVFGGSSGLVQLAGRMRGRDQWARVLRSDHLRIEGSKRWTTHMYSADRLAAPRFTPGRAKGWYWVSPPWVDRAVVAHSWEVARVSAPPARVGVRRVALASGGFSVWEMNWSSESVMPATLRRPVFRRNPGIPHSLWMPIRELCG